MDYVAGDSEMIALTKAALEDAWSELRDRTLSMTADEARSRIAEGILSAIADGERDRFRIKNLAILRAGLR